MALNLIAFDLDGTALDSGNRLTEGTVRALMKASLAGTEIVPVTGRCFEALPEKLADMGRRGYIRFAITSNGAETRNLRTGDIVSGNYISPEGAAEIKKALDDMDVMTEVYVKGKAFIEKSWYRKLEEGDIPYRDREYVLETRIPVMGVKQLLSVHEDRIEKVAVYFDSRFDRGRTKEALKSIRNARVTSSGRNNAEMIGKTCGKADALRGLCRMLGIPMKEVMAAGDNENDLDMLKAAGFSVVMGNADESIKAHGDYVTEDNDHDGLARAINMKEALGK